MTERSRKVGIITFHAVNNYGSVLQAYAIQQVIDTFDNADAYLINYRNKFIIFTDSVRLLPITSNIHEIVSGIRTFRQRLLRIKKFNDFIQTEKLCPSDTNDLEIYVCGSDQIWNPVMTGGILCRKYYLGNVERNKKKIAYGPSFGLNSIPLIYKNRIKKLVNDIDYISVREKMGGALLNKLGISDIKQVIDPTFLLTKEQWKCLTETSTVEPCKEKYIVIYIMQKDKKIYHIANRIKNKTGYKMVEISRYGYNPGFIDNTLVDVGPIDFLKLLANASYVITNSFHGAAFSILFEKKACIIPSRQFKGRVIDLLETLNVDELANINKNGYIMINFDDEVIKEQLNIQREKSYKYLEEALGK